jgi:hypothetical protein
LQFHFVSGPCLQGNQSAHIMTHSQGFCKVIELEGVQSNLSQIEELHIIVACAGKSREVVHTHPAVVRPWELSIPPIIHQIFLDGHEEYKR